MGINYDKKTKAHQCVIERVESDVLSLSQVCPKSVLCQFRSLENVDGNIVKLILEQTSNPVRIDVLMRAARQTNRSRFRTKYINPLLSEECVAMTQPDKPTSSKQQYYLTEKGLMVLKALLK